jgi:hypothetical protein
VVPGVSKAVLWGDDDKGPYGAFTKFTPGMTQGYTRTRTMSGSWFSRALTATRTMQEKRASGRATFIRVPGGRKHSSGGDAADGALFYEESSGKFDVVPAK